MSNYKIGLLIFSNSQADGADILRMFEKTTKDEELGVIKAVQMLDPTPANLRSVIEDYKNTNLGMIILVAPNAKAFFPYSELEEVGQQNEKYLVTLNLDNDLRDNLLKIIKKIKASPTKPYRGCDVSCS